MSSAAQFCINWVSYKNCISKGFSRFQQDGEFVDMTLAADGHLVKVHQTIVALASPYLKAMIQSTPCQHPVVFLNNVSQEMLCFILEYVYTGEVNIPTGSTPAFIEACKALHINGVEHFFLPKKPEPEPQSAETVTVTVERLEEPPPPPPENNFAAHITISSDLTDFNVEVIQNENNIINQQKQLLDTDLMNFRVLTDANIVDDQNNGGQEPFSPLSDCELSSPNCDIEENQNKTLSGCQNFRNIASDLTNKEKEIPSSAHSMNKYIPPSIGDRDKAKLYSISARGALQLLLNRFMYYCHHHSCYGRKRRWRCIDYRRLRCPAIIDTEDDTIINRSEDHIHTDHDTKILRKMKSKKVFSSLSQAQELVTEKLSRAKKRKRSSAASRGDVV